MSDNQLKICKNCAKFFQIDLPFYGDATKTDAGGSQWLSRIILIAASAAVFRARFIGSQTRMRTLLLDCYNFGAVFNNKLQNLWFILAETILTSK